MESNLISMMRKLAPDLTDEMTRRAMILERISVLQPVGRRQLAAKLNMPEREIRNAAMLLKDLGYLEMDAAGMSLSRKAEEILEVSVGAQLEAVMPAIGLGCTFRVRGDKVHMDLTRTFQGSVDLPISELQAFLADPERILGTLHPDGNSYVDDTGHAYLDPASRFLFP